jgi:sulfhydrogenase subunit beta (sulfur reductase)
VVGPSLCKGVVLLREITNPDDLASRILDVQAPGRYAVGCESPMIFAAVNGPDAAEKYLHPAEVELLRIKEGPRGFEVESTYHSQKKYAFLCIRPCDLKAVGLINMAVMVPGFEDPVYSSLRKDSIFVVVNCTRAGVNCFCATMGTGPGADSGCDLAITELPEKLR